MRYSLEFGTKRTLYLETKLTEHEATIDRLTTYIRTAPDREGDKAPIFRDSLIGNVRDLCRVVRTAVMLASRIASTRHPHQLERPRFGGAIANRA
jgi:hypothetical protein